MSVWRVVSKPCLGLEKSEGGRAVRLYEGTTGGGWSAWSQDGSEYGYLYGAEGRVGISALPVEVELRDALQLAELFLAGVEVAA